MERTNQNGRISQTVDRRLMRFFEVQYVFSAVTLPIMGVIAALVTYGDTVTIKYSQHSDYKLSENAAKNIVYESENAKFYMPDTNSVTVV